MTWHALWIYCYSINSNSLENTNTSIYVSDAAHSIKLHMWYRAEIYLLHFFKPHLCIWSQWINFWRRTWLCSSCICPPEGKPRHVPVGSAKVQEQNHCEQALFIPKPHIISANDRAKKKSQNILLILQELQIHKGKISLEGRAKNWGTLIHIICHKATLVLYYKQSPLWQGAYVKTTVTHSSAGLLLYFKI